MATLTRILTATDLEPCSEHAARFAFELARPLRAEVTVLYTYGFPGAPSATSFYAAASRAIYQQAMEDLASFASRSGCQGVHTRCMVRSGPAAETILSVARELGASLIVVGSSQRRGAERALLGSVAETVARTAPCPVLVVPAEQPCSKKPAAATTIRDAGNLEREADETRK